jgi:hypothetical protein
VPAVETVQSFVQWLDTECSAYERKSFEFLQIKQLAKKGLLIDDPDLRQFPEQTFGTPLTRIRLCVLADKLSYGRRRTNQIWFGLCWIQDGARSGEIIFLKAWRIGPSTDDQLVLDELVPLLEETRL